MKNQKWKNKGILWNSRAGGGGVDADGDGNGGGGGGLMKRSSRAMREVASSLTPAPTLRTLDSIWKVYVFCFHAPSRRRRDIKISLHYIMKGKRKISADKKLFSEKFKTVLNTRLLYFPVFSFSPLDFNPYNEIFYIYNVPILHTFIPSFHTEI